MFGQERKGETLALGFASSTLTSLPSRGEKYHLVSHRVSTYMPIPDNPIGCLTSDSRSVALESTRRRLINGCRQLAIRYRVSDTPDGRQPTAKSSASCPAPAAITTRPIGKTYSSTDYRCYLQAEGTFFPRFRTFVTHRAGVLPCHRAQVNKRVPGERRLYERSSSCRSHLSKTPTSQSLTWAWHRRSSLLSSFAI